VSVVTLYRCDSVERISMIIGAVREELVQFNMRSLGIQLIPFI
jgi:hypothetical protein